MAPISRERREAGVESAQPQPACGARPAASPMAVRLSRGTALGSKEATDESSSTDGLFQGLTLKIIYFKRV